MNEEAVPGSTIYPYSPSLKCIKSTISPPSSLCARVRWSESTARSMTARWRRRCRNSTQPSTTKCRLISHFASALIPEGSQNRKSSGKTSASWTVCWERRVTPHWEHPPNSNPIKGTSFDAENGQFIIRQSTNKTSRCSNGSRTWKGWSFAIKTTSTAESDTFKTGDERNETTSSPIPHRPNLAPNIKRWNSHQSTARAIPLRDTVHPPAHRQKRMSAITRKHIRCEKRPNIAKW